MTSWRQTILAKKFYRQSTFFRGEDNRGLKKLSFGKLKVYTMQRVSQKKKVQYIEDQRVHRHIKAWVRIAYLQREINKWQHERKKRLWAEMTAIIALKIAKKRSIHHFNANLLSKAILSL